LARRLGWTDEQIKDLHNFENRADFSDREKAALRLAERVTRDAHNIDDQFWNELRRHFDEGEVVELLAAIGVFNYFNRFNDALQMEPTK
jgi:alkylhydroperoxidase family enzyme